ncbi:unnamed protein product [Ascophyllum nodosum]
MSRDAPKQGKGKGKGAPSTGSKGKRSTSAPAAQEAPIKKEEPKSFVRRDKLAAMEGPAQQRWDADKVFEAKAEFNPDGSPKEKFMVTFPYPYMNGRLHLGHAYSMSKCEFMAQFQRLKGKNALFPFGFHCTGMPIQAAANKLKSEIAQFGCPPDFRSATVMDWQHKEDAPEKPDDKEVAVEKKGKGAKTKLVAKTGGAEVRQWDIMKMMVPEEEIPGFTDPLRWLRYFPPRGRDDMIGFGTAVDWRRSFVTTSVNPYYDSFIRWQFNTLKADDKVKFGKRANVYCVLDGQVCADHDRASGEGVGPQEYTIIKLRVLELRGKLSSLKGRDVFLAPATLRPETMYGQTNCFVLPDGDYGAYEMKDGSVLVVSARAARGMAHQDLTKVWGVAPCLLDGIKGTDLMGLPLKAPNAKYDKVFVLPLLTISMGKGTGVVTSVPSDAPDDYAALLELKEKPAFRAKFGLKDDMVMPFEVVPIIEIPGYGNTSAKLMCEKLKIKSCKEADKLKRAKEEVYLKGFYEGVMLVGPCAGDKVCDAKPKIRQELMDKSEAFAYFEPESQVMSRSGEECIVALNDQWYLPYGEESWAGPVRDHVNSKNFNAYTQASLSKFNFTLGWLKEWACTRLFGLGTRLPWDESWVIESLSDSTIYMAFYTVAHLLQGDNNMDGSKTGPLGVDASAMRDPEWDYVFLRGAYPEGSAVPEEKLAEMRTEFEYWYPMDLRCSAKDLIPNHLTMALYNHASVWKDRPELWPRGYFTNGHIQVDAQKMSKSKGNFLMMEDCVKRFGAGATRFALADAGDSLEDANFAMDSANQAILTLTGEEEWMSLMLQEAKQGKLRETPEEEYLFMDRAFRNEMDALVNKTDDAYGRMMWREGLHSGFFAMQLLRDFYRDWCAKTTTLMHKALVLRFIEVQTLLLAPICPHFAEHVWGLLGHSASGSVLQAKWPETSEVDGWMSRSFQFLSKTLRTFRTTAQKSKAAVKSGHVYVASSYPQWKQDTLSHLRQCLEDNGGKEFAPDVIKGLKAFTAGAGFDKKQSQAAMQFAAFVKAEYEEAGPQALESTLPFDQTAILEENTAYIRDSLGVEEVRILDAEGEEGDARKKSSAEPGRPTLYLF